MNAAAARKSNARRPKPAARNPDRGWSAVDRAMDPLLAQLADLERRMDALEARRAARRQRDRSVVESLIHDVDSLNDRVAGLEGQVASIERRLEALEAA